jgi:hypothetical protein
VVSGLASLVLLTAPALACRVDLQATVKLTRLGGLILVPVTLNGVTTDFVLDTGAERTVVGMAAAARLKIARDEWISTDMLGAGGRDQQRLGDPASLSLGGIALRRHTVAADRSVVVGPVPEAVAGHVVSGLLGQDYLSLFDLDLDPATDSLKLYGVTGCSGDFLPWTGKRTALPAGRPIRNILVLPVRVDGQALTAEVDTGASNTTLMQPAMVRLGLAGGGPDQVHGFGKGSTTARIQDFTLQVGNLPAAPAALVVAPFHALRSVDMLLGADWLLARHVWISWATNQVFVAD